MICNSKWKEEHRLRQRNVNMKKKHSNLKHGFVYEIDYRASWLQASWFLMDE